MHNERHSPVTGLLADLRDALLTQKHREIFGLKFHEILQH